jgi:ribosomal protein S21
MPYITVAHDFESALVAFRKQTSGLLREVKAKQYFQSRAERRREKERKALQRRLKVERSQKRGRGQDG